MAKKSVIQPFKAIDAGDMAGDILGEFTCVKNQDNMSYQVKWSGTAPLGEILVEVTNDDLDNLNNIPTAQWTELDFGTPINIAANSGDHLLNINQNPGAYIRIRYARTSGDGSLTCTLVSKALGA